MVLRLEFASRDFIERVPLNDDTASLVSRLRSGCTFFFYGFFNPRDNFAIYFVLSLFLSLSDLFLDKSGINEVAMEMMNEGIAAKRKGWLWIYDTSIATKFEEDPGVREMLSEMQTLRRP